MSEKLKRKIKWLTLLLLFIIVAGYAIYQMRNILTGVQIKFANIKNGDVFTQSFKEIDGQAKNARSISLNDRAIFIDQQGFFKENILLLPGYNLLSFKTEDRFGNKREKVLEIYYKQPN